MKTLVPIVQFIFLLVIIQTIPVAAQTRGAVAAYPFSEGAGTTVEDVSGQFNTGTLVGGSIWTASGKYGTAISFDGITGYISVPASSSLDIVETGTMEAWVNLTDIHRWNGVIAKGDVNSNKAMNYSIEINPNNAVECTVGNGWTATILESMTALTAGEFYHVACTWDGTTVSIYINGMLDNSIPQDVTPDPNSSPLYIGQFGGDVDRTSGIIDGVRIYDVALSPTEIQIDMNTPVSELLQPQISVLPEELGFAGVTVGLFNTQTVTLSNSGNVDLSVTEAALIGSDFALSGLPLPLIVAPGQSIPFTVSFAPTSAGTSTGSLSLVSNAQTPPLTIAISGTSVAAVQHLAASPASLSFGDVAVGGSRTQIVTLTNTGNLDVSVSRIELTGPAYGVTGLALPVTLSPLQTVDFAVVFAPITVGSQAGSVTILSTASNPVTISASASGVLSGAHSVTLSWSPSTSTVSGYYVYRGNQLGGPYSGLNTIPIDATTYLDTAVETGLTYYYVLTAVDSAGIESSYSDESFATIP